MGEEPYIHRVIKTEAQARHDVDRLRTWYLARLRRGAVETGTSGDLTPVTLITVDRQFIEKIAADKVAGPAKRSALAPATGTYVWLVGAAILCSLIFLLGGLDPRFFISVMHDVSFGLFFPTTAAAPEGPLHQACVWLLGAFCLGWPVLWFIVRPLVRPSEKDAQTDG